MNNEHLNLTQQVSTLTTRLKEINERLADPMASEETIRELLKTKNELIADKQEAEIKLDQLEHMPRSFDRSLNESFEL